MAKELGISRSYVYGIEKGRS
ncbi:helix-turn-helix domain-containing protein [Paenibacillus elgii]